MYTYTKKDTATIKLSWFTLGLIVGMIISSLIFYPFKFGEMNINVILGEFLVKGGCPVDLEFNYAMDDFTQALRNNSGATSVHLTEMLRMIEPASVLQVTGQRGLSSMINYYERCTRTIWETPR